MRQTSDRNLSNVNSAEKKAKAMGGVAVLGPDMPAAYVRKMIEMETRGNGDQMNAIERVSRDVGMSPRSVRRLVNGETDPGMKLFARIHKAYLDKCARMAAALLHQIEVEKARFGSEHFEDIGAEALALRAKIEARKKGIAG